MQNCRNIKVQSKIYFSYRVPSVSRCMRLTECNPHQAGEKSKTAVEMFLLPTKLHFQFWFICPRFMIYSLNISQVKFNPMWGLYKLVPGAVLYLL